MEGEKRENRATRLTGGRGESDRERVQCFVRARWTRRHSDRRLFIIASSGRVGWYGGERGVVYATMGRGGGRLRGKKG